MKKKVAIARTIETAIRLPPPKVRMRKTGRKNLPQVHTFSEAGRRGGYIPPGQSL